MKKIPNATLEISTGGCMTTNPIYTDACFSTMSTVRDRISIAWFRTARWYQRHVVLTVREWRNVWTEADDELLAHLIMKSGSNDFNDDDRDTINRLIERSAKLYPEHDNTDFQEEENERLSDADFQDRCAYEREMRGEVKEADYV